MKNRIEAKYRSAAGDGAVRIRIAMCASMCFCKMLYQLCSGFLMPEYCDGKGFAQRGVQSPACPV